MVDVWANPSQASVFRELAATFGQWALSEETVGDALRLRFERKAPA
ncbi:hypothetical protein [Fundidesulfovibrio magnetotacticus]|nr:hypothetical protein [Fundidesulfovibrio magnetotacticus]